MQKKYGDRLLNDYCLKELAQRYIFDITNYEYIIMVITNLFKSNLAGNFHLNKNKLIYSFQILR